MRTRFVLALGLWVVILLTCSRAQAASIAVGSDLTDERLGFKLLPPTGWTPIPQTVDERWIVAKYLSDKSYRWTEKGGFTIEHKPDMVVIAFPHQAPGEKPATKEGQKQSEPERDVRYKDYKDFLVKRYTGGGFFISSETEDKLGDTATTRLEYKVEKNSDDGPKRILTWIYHLSDVDLAVQFESLEDAYPKLQAEFERCLRSFKTIARSAAASPAGAPAKKLQLDLDQLKPEERKLERIAMERDAHARATSNVPPGWTAKKMGRFLVVNHSDERLAKRVVERAEAVWNWLEANFGFIGAGEYVRSPIIRICKDQAEEDSYYKNDGDNWTWNNIEIFTHDTQKDDQSEDDDHAAFELGWINRRVAAIWFEDRDRELYWAMPEWLSQGLDEVIGLARPKGNKMEFHHDEWDKQDVRAAFKERKVTPPRKLMTMGGESFFKEDLHRQEAAALVGFFFTGPAAKNPKTKNVIADYLKNLKAVTLAIEAENAQAAAKTKKKAPASEEDEAAYFKKERASWKELEARVLDETWKKTFKDWKDTDWKQFDDIYFKSID